MISNEEKDNNMKIITRNDIICNYDEIRKDILEEENTYIIAKDEKPELVLIDAYQYQELLNTIDSLVEEFKLQIVNNYNKNKK